MADKLAKLEKLTIGYDRALLSPISFSINRGDFWGVVGPNGAGKSTLIKTIIGLIPKISGQLVFPAGNIRFGYVPQRHHLNNAYPLTAIDVVLMGRYNTLSLLGRPSGIDRQMAIEELGRVQMDKLAYSDFAALSGGQKQRVLLARALVTKPDLLILDEPTSGMDLAGELKTLQFLRKLQSDKKTTIMMIEHNLQSVANVTTHLCIINKDRDVCEVGEAKDLLDEDSLMNLFGIKINFNRFGRKGSIVEES